MPRILVIDDYQDVLAMIQDVLVYVGYKVNTAPSISKGVEQAKQQPPDLVLCDWQLPDGTGAEVVHQLAGTKVIIITVNNAVLDEVTQAAIAGYILKPFGLEELLGTIQSVLNDN